MIATALPTPTLQEIVRAYVISQVEVLGVNTEYSDLDNPNGYIYGLVIYAAGKQHKYCYNCRYRLRPMVTGVQDSVKLYLER